MQIADQYFIIKYIDWNIWEGRAVEKLEPELKTLSLTGRLCYLFMCIEKYLTLCYPEREWILVAKRCWQWTNVYWNEGCDIYSAVVPEYLFEFDDYEKTNTLAFDGKLSQKDYLELTNLFAGLTTGNPEDEINQVLKLPIEFNNECECTDFNNADIPTLKILYKMLHFLSLHNISFPFVNDIQNMTVDQKNGWGNFIDSEYLSVII